MPCTCKQLFTCTDSACGSLCSEQSFRPPTPSQMSHWTSQDGLRPLRTPQQQTSENRAGGQRRSQREREQGEQEQQQQQQSAVSRFMRAICISQLTGGSSFNLHHYPHHRRHKHPIPEFRLAGACRCQRTVLKANAGDARGNEKSANSSHDDHR